MADTFNDYFLFHKKYYPVIFRPGSIFFTFACQLFDLGIFIPQFVNGTPDFFLASISNLLNCFCAFLLQLIV